jgi:hypothetical protein
MLRVECDFFPYKVRGEEDDWMTMPSRILLMLCTAVAASALSPGAIVAQTEWLKKGQDLLDTYGGTDAVSSTLSNEEITNGLKQALKVGSRSVVNQLGAPGGFNDDPAVHIPLPDSLDTVRSALDKVGMSSMLDDLDLRMNRAAEAAMPKTKRLFVNAVSEMSLDDARAILAGPDDAATRYFQGKMTPALKQEMRPVVEASLADVGAIQSFDQVMEQYQSIPFVPDVKAELSDHVVEKASDGIFHYLALEEAAIRQNPAKRTTKLMQKVFGGS